MMLATTCLCGAVLTGTVFTKRDESPHVPESEPTIVDTYVNLSPAVTGAMNRQTAAWLWERPSNVGHGVSAFPPSVSGTFG